MNRGGIETGDEEPRSYLFELYCGSFKCSECDNGGALLIWQFQRP